MLIDKHKITFWQDGQFWLGYISDYPEYVTQGLTYEDLIEHLKDLYHDISNELVK